VQNYENALHEAVKDGFVDVLNKLVAALPKKLVLAQGVLNFLDDRERTPLHYAAARNFSGAVSVLVRAGADINAKGNRDRTPLHTAAYCGAVHTVRTLCELGANVNARDADGDTPCDDAQGKGRLQVLAIMQQFGAHAGPPKASAPNHATLVEMTAAPLVHAIKGGDVERVKALAGAGHDINGGDTRGVNALHLAAQVNDVEAVQVLIAAGAIVNLPDKLGNTPLHYAAGFGSAEAAEVLLKAGANRYQENVFGQCPFHVVKQIPSEELDGGGAEGNVSRQSSMLTVPEDLLPPSRAPTASEVSLTSTALAAAAELPMIPPPPPKVYHKEGEADLPEDLDEETLEEQRRRRDEAEELLHAPGVVALRTAMEREQQRRKALGIETPSRATSQVVEVKRVVKKRDEEEDEDEDAGAPEEGHENDETVEQKRKRKAAMDELLTSPGELAYRTAMERYAEQRPVGLWDRAPSRKSVMDAASGSKKSIKTPSRTASGQRWIA
jgi:ankyrin repeat protein